MMQERLSFHHITVKGVPLCCSEDVQRHLGDTPCGHTSKAAAKTAILRLIEHNPMFPVCHYRVVEGHCPGGYMQDGEYRMEGG